jgi:Trk-type K+ transport system membrane component
MVLPEFRLGNLKNLYFSVQLAFFSFELLSIRFKRRPVDKDYNDNCQEEGIILKFFFFFLSLFFLLICVFIIFHEQQNSFFLIKIF